MKNKHIGFFTIFNKFGLRTKGYNYKKNHGYFDYLFSLLSLLKYEPSLQM